MKARRKKRCKMDDEPTSLENLLLELSQNLLDNPNCPYLLWKADGDHEDGANQGAITTAGKADINLLQHCGVAQFQPENKNMICLVDFRR